VDYAGIHDMANNSDPVPTTRLKIRKAALNRPVEQRTIELQSNFK